MELARQFSPQLVLIIVKPSSVGDVIELVASAGKGKVIDIVFKTLEVAPGATVMIPNNIFFPGPFSRRVGDATVGLDQQLRTYYPQR